MRRSIGVCLAAAMLVAACERGSGTDQPQADSRMQEQAALEACLASALVERAVESRETLEAFGDEDGVGPAQAALRFALAYEAAAELRHTALAFADSALNHAATRADSSRYMARASEFRPRTPEPGTLEANVSASWLRDFQELRADQDHRCHWDR
jgi:hypothetical protein